jgi:hypothetical protein
VGGRFLRDVLKYAAIDRLLALPPVDWSGRFHDIYTKNRAAQKSAEQQKLAPRRAGTKPAFALDEYAGEYEHPGYGVVTIGRDPKSPGGDLTLGYNGFSAALPHLHLEVFQSPHDELSEFDESRVQFLSSFEGEVEALRVEFEPAVKPIEFKRLPDKRFKDPAFLMPMTGDYAIGVREWTVRLRSDGVLTVAGRTGAPLELIGARGTRFNVKDQAGFQIEFVADANGRYTQMALHRSGSSSVAQRLPKP